MLGGHAAEVALAAALAWGAGLRLYLVVFLVGAAGRFGYLQLPDHLLVLQQPVVLVAAAFMAVVEMFADKIPWLDSAWDAVHTFIRIPLGAALTAAAFGDSGTATTVAAALLGGTFTATTHLTKASVRAVANTSPEPFSNVAISFGEDAAVVGGTWLAAHHPVVFLSLFVAFIVLAWASLRVLFRLLRRRFAHARRGASGEGPG